MSSADIEEVDPSEILFLDDNAGNLELAEDYVSIYQPQAGPNSVGLNLIELQCLINALGNMEASNANANAMEQSTGSDMMQIGTA